MRISTRPARLLPRLLCALLALMGAGSGARAQFVPSAPAEPSAEPSEAVTVSSRLSQGAKAGGRADLILALAIHEPFHINANPASESYLIATQVLVGKAAGVKAGKPIYPKPKGKKFAFYPGLLKVYEGKVEVRVPLSFSSAYKGAPVAGSLKYQACNDQSCLAPVTVSWKVSGGAAGKPGGDKAAASTLGSGAEAGAGAEVDAVALRERFHVKGLPTVVFLGVDGAERADLRAGEELSLGSMERKLDAVRSGQKQSAESGSARDWGSRLEGAPLLLQLGLVFVGGLLLNLTPCVFPMIPITVGYFGAQSEGRAGKTFGLSDFTGLGHPLVSSALGVFAALTGGLFGATMQSPWVLGAVALVLGALGLSMAGLFTINPPRWAMSHAGAKKGALGALAMGALLGIVAAPCVGPAVAALLTIVAARADVLYGFSMFFSLSLGLGLPYLLLGTFSGSAKSLPRAGAWMEKSKKIFALPLVLAGLYFGYLAVNAASTSDVAMAAEQSTPAKSVGGKAWRGATLLALEQARAQGRPVVLDFRADWCLPCLKMEEEIFKQQSTLDAAAKSNALLLQVDLTKASG